MTGPDGKRVVLDRSARAEPRDASRIGPTDPQQQIAVSVIVRRKTPLRALERERRLTRDEYLATYAADPADFETIRAFAKAYGLAVDEAASSLARRTVRLRGPAAVMQQAFGVTLNDYKSASGGRFHGFSGKVSAPEAIAPVVEAVLGLDNRPLARPNVVVGEPASGPGGSKGFTAPQVASLYDFPTGTGRGQTVGILEFGGGFKDSDFQTYFKALGMGEPTVTTVLVDKGTNSPGTDDDADAEVALDVEVFGAMAPSAKIVVYFSENTDCGWADAVSTAVMDTTNNLSLISISWGGPEDNWPEDTRTSVDDSLHSAIALNITTLVAAGDDGSKNKETTTNVQFPASSANVLACGGTTLTVKAGVIADETVWNRNSTHATGGGVSAVFAEPTWQSAGAVQIKPHNGKAAALTKRGVPDVSGNADPETGYQIYYGGKWQLIGGTSAVAPLWAALVAICNELTHTSAGFINTTLYGDPAPAFRDITKGNNAVSGSGWDATIGWDGCTGLGSPFGPGVATLLGVPGVNPLPFSPAGAFELHNSGAFVVDIHALYKSPNAVTWHEQANKHNFPVGQTKTMNLLDSCKSPPIEPGWMVKMKVWVDAGDDHTASETFLFSDRGPTEKYKITGTTLDNTLHYEGT